MIDEVPVESEHGETTTRDKGLGMQAQGNGNQVGHSHEHRGKSGYSSGARFPLPHLIGCFGKRSTIPDPHHTTFTVFIWKGRFKYIFYFERYTLYCLRLF